MSNLAARVEVTLESSTGNKLVLLTDFLPEKGFPTKTEKHIIADLNSRIGNSGFYPFNNIWVNMERYSILSMTILETWSVNENSI
jgi:hypothetical protein